MRNLKPVHIKVTHSNLVIPLIVIKANILEALIWVAISIITAVLITHTHIQGVATHTMNIMTIIILVQIMTQVKIVKKRKG